MVTVNVVVLAGTVAADPVERRMPSGDEVVIPAGTIGRIDVDDKKIFVALTKDQIKDSPEYDPTHFDADYRTRLGTYYDPFL
jgi:single-stranded DNA-binding protein